MPDNAMHTDHDQSLTQQAPGEGFGEYWDTLPGELTDMQRLTAWYSFIAGRTGEVSVLTMLVGAIAQKGVTELQTLGAVQAETMEEATLIAHSLTTVEQTFPALKSASPAAVEAIFQLILIWHSRKQHPDIISEEYFDELITYTCTVLSTNGLAVSPEGIRATLAMLEEER